MVFEFAEDIETSLSDYLKALNILEHLDQPDSRHIAEMYPLLNLLAVYEIFLFFSVCGADGTFL